MVTFENTSDVWFNKHHIARFWGRGFANSNFPANGEGRWCNNVDYTNEHSTSGMPTWTKVYLRWLYIRITTKGSQMCSGSWKSRFRDIWFDTVPHNLRWKEWRTWQVIESQAVVDLFGEFLPREVGNLYVVLGLGRQVIRRGHDNCPN
jgi:hypothetical protein